MWSKHLLQVFKEYKMHKKIVIPLVCAIILTVIASVAFFRLTSVGQSFLYSTFGGSNLHLISGEKAVFWFDVRHSNDPNDPMFKRIEDNFLKFKPDLILVEGGFNTFEGSRDEAIIDGESAFATYLAKRNGVAVEDIEPPFSDQITYLQTKHQPESILAMYLIRQINSEQSMPIDTGFDFERYLQEETQYLIDNGLDVSLSSLENILSVVNSYLPQKIDADTWKNVENLYRVYNQKGDSLYPIYNDVYNFRNIYLVELIREKLQDYDKIYIVMGGQHLLDTKSQLKELYSTVR